jgi:dihydrofolate reductase
MAPRRIEGFAIVSEDGMLADANGVMPETLKFDVDWQYFAAGLDRLDAVIHGRHSHEQQPHSPRRYRITVTTQVAAIAPDADNPKGILWNPAAATFEEAWSALGLGNGTLGVIGGTSVFGMFLDLYDVFHLTRAPNLRLPGGRPVFPGVPEQTPEQIMQTHGLRAAEHETLDAAHGIVVARWRRA